MIDVVELTKRFGHKVAVDALTFTVPSGVVTGFLGPNGAGKSTTMRLILGLDHPTGGRARVNGRNYVSTKAPLTEVGAMLDVSSVHPGRSARTHLRVLAATHGIPAKRVDYLLDLVGLAPVARQRIGSFSLGMSQRLGLAAALLGDPETLILDEPINGLDPEGVAWVRDLVKHLAAQGRTLFISSHLMSEMSLTADHVIIIGRGRLIKDSAMADLIAEASGLVTKVRSPHMSEIADVVVRSGRSVKDNLDGTYSIAGLTPQAIGQEAARRGWVLYELTPVRRTLEDVYLELTDTALEFHTGGPAAEAGPATPAPSPAPRPRPAPAQPTAAPRSSGAAPGRPGAGATPTVGAAPPGNPPNAVTGRGAVFDAYLSGPTRLGPAGEPPAGAGPGRTTGLSGSGGPGGSGLSGVGVTAAGPTVPEGGTPRRAWMEG
jgi:ABC-2 type transport system ATP-binding protein